MRYPASRKSGAPDNLRLLIISVFTVSMTLLGFSQTAKTVPADQDTRQSILQAYGSYLTPANELVSLRNRTSRHYAVDGNLNVAMLSSTPIFYAGPGGRLEEILDLIVSNDDRAGDGYRFRNQANDVLFYFSGEADRCAIQDVHGDVLAVVTSAYASPAGDVSSAENHLYKIFKQDSSDFAWTVEGSSVSYRYFINRKIPVEDLGPGVHIDWRQPVTELDNFEDEWPNGRMSATTVATDGSHGDEWCFGETVAQTETTTTILGYITLDAGQTGSILKSSPGNTPIPAGSSIRVQNMSDPGCTYGYRGWAKYDLSVFDPADTIYSVEQHIYASALESYWYDAVDINVTHLRYDPEVGTAQATWEEVGVGFPYVYDLGVFGTGWRTIQLSGVLNDFSGAIASPGWFGLGFMVWCDENNSNFFVTFSGVGGGNSPYLYIVYSPITDVAEDDPIPVHYTLSQNYPNPFNPVTTISYTLPAGGHVRLSVSNILGQEVAVLADGEQAPGEKTISFDALDLPSGVYIYRLSAGSFTDVKKMMLVR